METTVEEDFEEVDDPYVQQGMFGKTFVNLYCVADCYQIARKWCIRGTPKDFFGTQHSGSSSLIRNVEYQKSS